MDAAQVSRTEFGAKVRAYRELRGLSMEELGVKVARTRASISRIENGKQEVGILGIRKLAAALDVLPSALIDTQQVVDKPSQDEVMKGVLHRWKRKMNLMMKELEDAGVS